MKMPIPPIRPLQAFVSAATIAIAFLLSSCGSNENSPRGFRLPDGNAENGQMAFTKLGCIQCHSVAGVEDSFPTSAKRTTHVILGGEVRRVKTYGHLVTSIINPSHKIKDPTDESQTVEPGVSVMPDLTGQMTVAEMIDLVAYLQPKYDVIIEDFSDPYPLHGYRY